MPQRREGSRRSTCCTRSGTTWKSQQAALSPAGAGTGAFNGLALQGDELVTSGSGSASISLVSDAGAVPAETGVVYTFNRSGASWTPGPALRVPAAVDNEGDVETDGQFGSAVALSNGTLAVGADLETGPAINSLGQPYQATSVGAVYAFTAGSTASSPWSQQVRASSADAFDQHGGRGPGRARR